MTKYNQQKKNNKLFKSLSNDRFLGDNLHEPFIVKKADEEFQEFLYEDAKFRALKELMNLTPDQVLLLGRRK